MDKLDPVDNSALGRPAAEPEEDAELGRLLASAQRRRGLTQAEAAALLGTTQQTYNRWRLGRSRPHPVHLSSLARFLECDPSSILRLVGKSSARRVVGTAQVVSIGGAAKILTDRSAASRQAFVEELREVMIERLRRKESLDEGDIAVLRLLLDT